MCRFRRHGRPRGGSSGIGLAIAHMLGEEDHGLTVARPDKLAGAAPELHAARPQLSEAVRFALHVSPACVIPEIVFQRPDESV